MRDTAFIVTKPLQILVAASIIKQLRIEKDSHLVVVDSFHNAELVCQRMKKANWSLVDLSVRFEGSAKAAYDFVKKSRFQNIFIDADVGFRKYIDLARLKFGRNDVRVYVYEEGIGTYRTDLYSGMKKKIFDALGIATNFGGCSLTDGIYVFEDKRYREIFSGQRTNVAKIFRGVADTIGDEFEHWAYVMNYAPLPPGDGLVCNIYLSSWKVDANFLDVFRQMKGEKFIKLHPNIKEKKEFKFAISIEQTTPAELVLMDLAKKYKEINIIHHGSSVETYLNLNNLNFKKI